LDIDGWLRGIGLAQYAEIFRANDIDGEVLRRVTNDDLKDIGVVSFGHRKKLLEAIAELGSAPASLPAVPDPTPTPATVAPPPFFASIEATGERRHATVMFCDLVDSTGIAARLDAEEWRDLVGAYLDAASTPVTEMGGKVAKKLGDGLMALFGYPVAQENDAERAVRAALSIQRSLAELNRKNEGTGKPALAVRIAIDSGPVVVDAAGEVFGDVPNIAARTQALAEPGAVVVTAPLQRQIAGLFVAEERGSHELKGVPEPVTLFRIVRASGGGRRSGARQLTSLVGREDEMTMLLRRWERARQGDGQLVLIVGEPGLGKSRLIEEFHSRLADTLRTWVGVELLSAIAEHAAPSDRRMGPGALRRRGGAGRAAARRPREFARPGQARSGGECPAACAAPRRSSAQAACVELGAGLTRQILGSLDRNEDAIAPLFRVVFLCAGTRLKLSLISQRYAASRATTE
jgi:class 3 adenylate cyclase